ncbi:MAG: glycoside hydrolase family 30 protein [Gemmatimonadaceae bacterium]
MRLTRRTALATLATGAFLAALACAGPEASAATSTAPSLATIAAGDTVSVWLTNGDRSALLARQPNLLFATATNDNPSIVVDDATTHQTMDGFGYTLTGGSALVINRMPAAPRQALLQELFGRGPDELGISYLRLSIGASDLSAYPFTYDEMPAGQTDPALAQFSIAEDQKDLLPVLKQILAINPGIALMGTPWTAPTWMKDNRAFVGGSLLRANFPVYAQYFVRYLQAMKAEGITVGAITVQNEPLHDGNNPSMYMTAVDQAELVKNHLGPALRGAGLDTKIVLYDHNADHTEYPISILDDPAAKAYADGSAFHLYGGTIDQLAAVHTAHPDRSLYFTEQYTGASGSFSGDLRWHVRNVLTGAPTYWCRTVLEWNLASDEAWGPHTAGGCSNCLGAVTINSGSSAVTRNVAYYIVGHGSRFVEPGSVRVRSTVANAARTTKLSQVAFRTPAGKHVLIAMNDGQRAQTFNVSFGGRSVTTSLKVGSVATLVW